MMIEYIGPSGSSDNTPNFVLASIYAVLLGIYSMFIEKKGKKNE
jgi:hypothetical protein